MILFIADTWCFFLICLAVLLSATIVMTIQSRNFVTMGQVKKEFSIFDLEFPMSGKALFHLITGIDKLPSAEGARSKNALKGQLYVDFIYMPGVYLAIFLLCMKTATKIHGAGGYVFAVLAWLQLVAWLGDIIENVFLLLKISNPQEPSVTIFKAYQVLEFIKWGSATKGFICSCFALLFFFITGKYTIHSLNYFYWMLLELSLFGLITYLTRKVK
ncbi:hypothetical protein [Mucilaginibacter dorajii]|uniref:Uncharacterized protein n=1 Tax=Mucilaginibacter dorajii TaxID=692994 RepID=A0ABP7PQQ0_9SPHI|nr:hypothetical protein [Mucilaginibacter dorajii]MCS3737591.1 hypothetical protein [Mucilaginibacter dorajii]